MTNAIINPDGMQPIGSDHDKYFPEEIAKHVPSLLVKLASIFTILALVGTLMCFRKQEENSALIDVEPDYSLTELFAALRHRSFVITFINNCLTVGTGIMISS